MPASIWQLMYRNNVVSVFILAVITVTNIHARN